MGVSLALVFHLASAAGALILGGWVLRLQRDIHFLRQMAVWARSDSSSGAGAASSTFRVAATAPILIRRMARASGVPVSGKLLQEKNFPVVAMDPRPLSQIFLRSPISLVQFTHSTVSILFRASTVPDGMPDPGRLSASVAGSARFEILITGSDS